MAELPADFILEFQAGLSKLNFFLQNTLSNESLSSEADVHKQECVTLVEGMISSLNNMKKSNMKDDNLLNNGLSVSSQSLDETYDLNGIADQGIPRSGSLPDMSTYMQPEDLGNWQASKTKKGSYYADFDHEEINLNDLRQLVIYHPTEEEDTFDNNEDDVHHHNTLNTSNELNTSNCSPVNKRKSRKRDSAALFDISLEDLTEPDFAGLLREKHSEKLWWCVLIDQHLCIFPSQDPEEVAYDVIIMPCCQISLDDRLMRTPVFRLTQSDMVPWVFVASNNDELKEWMKVLTIAASAGKHSSVTPSNTNEKKLSAPPQAPLMQSILEEEEEEELDEFAEVSLSSSFKSDANHLSSQSFKKCSELNESDNNLPVGYVNGESVKNGYEKKELPKRPDEVDGEKFVEDPYEDVANQKRAEENFQDDGFATDEFDSASSDGGDVSTIPQTQPVQKAKKTKQFFKWLKKKAKKGKLFSSPEDGVALAGYAFKSNDSSKRWFLIREQKLLCFKTIKDEDPEITVDLNGSEIKVGEEEKAKLAIQVIRDGTNHFTLVAKTLKDWERWKKAFLIESGFIQLAVSLTDTSSGFYDQEEDGQEGEYVTPIASPGSEKTPTPTSNTFPLNKNNETDDEDLYMEVVPSTVTTVEKLKSSSPSSSLLELGPLPPLPPDLPPRNTPDGAEGDGNEESCQITWESEEIYEEVSSSVANADKVIKWQGLNSKKIEVCPTGIQGKPSDKSAKGPVPAGVSDGAIEDSAITASSFLDNSSKPSAGRLNSSVGAWCAKGNDKQQYLQIDLGEVDKVCGVASQGKPGFLDQGGWFVKTYTLAYSKNGENWANYKEFGIAKVFQGNSDPDTVVTNMLKMAVNARYVRIKPQSWHNHIAMRVEVYKGEASSKLTAGIHKLADTLTKTTKKKTADRQRATSSPVEIEEEDDYSAGKPTLERNDSFDEKVKYINRPSSKENLLDGDEECDKENQVTGVDNEAVTNEEELAADDYLQLVREPTEEEKQVELKVQQRIEAGRKGEQIGRSEVSQGIKARKSLYENNQPSETTQDQRRDSVSKAPKETEVVTKKQKYIVEKKEVEEEKTENKAKDKKERNSSNSSQRDPDREREELEQTEKAFQNYAKQLKEEGGPVVKEKRASIVALNRLNFEDPRSASKAKENGTYPEKMESLLKEKEELLKKMENLRKRLSVAKDRKIFFSLSTSRSKATTDADAEFHESQNEMTKTKKRLMEIENETKNLKVMELRYQKTPEKTNPEKSLRKNSRECKLGSVEVQSSRMAISSPSSGKDKEKELAQTGSVLSQIKAFEQMKKK